MGARTAREGLHADVGDPVKQLQLDPLDAADVATDCCSRGVQAVMVHVVVVCAGPARGEAGAEALLRRYPPRTPRRHTGCTL